MIVDVQGLIADAKAKSQARAAKLIARLKAGGASENLPVIESAAILTGEEAAAQGRYFDLLVIGLNPEDATLRATAEGAVFGAGRPVLLVPENEPPAPLGHVMIAWDGSRVSARAVHDARHFLERASKVTVVSVADEKPLPGDTPGEALAQRLAKAGFDASFSSVQAKGKPIGEALQAHALSIGAGVLVMGGFGHSRMRDFVLGGATRGVLKDLKLPVLISH